MRIPVTTRLAIEDFQSGQVTVPISKTQNVVYGKRADGRIFATQRPGINLEQNASDDVADTQGRGVYYWSAVDATYFVNNDTIYKSNYAGPLGVNITAGTQRVDMFEVGQYLVLIDAENNQGWTIDSTVAGGTTLVEITDVDFPPKQTPARTLAKGGASLNDTMYVYCTDGTIWNSSVEDPTAWAGTDFISSEVFADGGVMMYLHNQHLAAIGNRSIEFFYDAGNETGSPLNARIDIVYDIGAADFHSAWAEANQVFFVGITSSGDAGVYRLSGLKLDKVSDNDLDSLITTAITKDSISVIGSGFSAGGRAFYILTVYSLLSGSIAPAETYVYDNTIGWTTWELMHDGINRCPVVDWTQGVSTRAGEGILSNGDLVSPLDDFNPVDSTEATGWVEDGWVEPGWVTSTSADGTNISMEIIPGPGDFGSRNRKFQGELRWVGIPTSTSQNLLVQWSDEGNDNYNTGSNIDVSNIKNSLSRGGSFYMRNYKMTYAGSEKLEIEALEGDFS